jgi:hypothetical protein
MTDIKVSKLTVLRALAEMQLKPLDLALAACAVGVSNSYEDKDTPLTTYDALVPVFESWVSSGDNAKARALLQDLWPNVLLETWRHTTTK